MRPLRVQSLGRFARLTPQHRSARAGAQEDNREPHSQRWTVAASFRLISVETGRRLTKSFIEQLVAIFACRTSG